MSVPFSALFLVVLCALPVRAEQVLLPATVTVRVGARVTVDEARVELPGGEQRVLEPGDRVHLPPGCNVVLAEGEARSYTGGLTLARHGGEIVAVLEVDTDTYLAGVVASEMGDDAPRDALRAQAVAARTMVALGRDRHPEGGWPLCDLTHCQSFRGVTTSEAAMAAVRDTAGLVLAVDGTVVEAPFHSTCGGDTLSSEAIWGTDQAHLRGVHDRRTDRSPWCAASPHGEWTAAVTAADLPDPTTDPVRFHSEVGHRHGWNVVRSHGFSVTPLHWHGTNVWLLQGTGLGHRVGLCQHGAIARASDGWTYEAILAAYYPGTRLLRLKTEARSTPP